jgi:hypothetical protein
VLEDHREHRDRLADRLLLEAGGMEFGDEVGDGLRVNPLDGGVAEAGEKSAQRDLVGLQRPRRDVDARSFPSFGQLP